MKTRERILHVSQLLFNDEGEDKKTALEIANALEISPGNLYYHFKGKDAIIRELFDNFEHEMRLILRGSLDRVTSIQDKWIYLYIILEEIYDFRFFYRNLGVMLDRYPDLAVRFRILQSEKHLAIQHILTELSRDTVLKLDPFLKATLSEQILLNLTFWLSADAIKPTPLAGPRLIHQTVFQIMCLIAPYMGEEGFETLKELLEHYQSIQV